MDFGVNALGITFIKISPVLNYDFLVITVNGKILIPFK